MQNHTINAKPLSQSTEQEVMIDCVKSRRQMQELRSSEIVGTRVSAGKRRNFNNFGR